MIKSVLKTNAIKSFLNASAVFISRLGLLPANINLLGSFGFFSQNLGLFFITIILFDYLVGGFYPGFWLTYMGFAMYPLLGKLARSTKLKMVLLPVASFAFFLISNLGVWWYWYPHTWVGLSSCYLLAIPFYKNTLIGDLLFGYGYLLALSLKKNLSLKKKLLTADALPLAQPSPQL